ncbi:hypothetical protein TeGR_g15303 [Tetraparma gracilis]|uniref:Sec-independent protein translocase protein TatB n=1 Tax=Tetraparma gracilis TaxID=2962635 RepID=A0ABQ6NAF9_9STRA|nr:hypothetical protein TeGR_g15303 [Tetraparma gracilis]
MLDASWGELLVIGGVACVAIGRKDLPSFARMAGRGVGNSVSFLRYVRRTADNLSSQLEATNSPDARSIKALREEVSLGLREMEDVREDLTSARESARARSLMRQAYKPKSLPKSQPTSQPASFSPQPPAAPLPVAPPPAAPAAPLHPPPSQPLPSPPLSAAPASSAALTAAAVAESTWGGEVANVNAGAPFVAVGERSLVEGEDGSSVLADLLKENLIHEHYERVKDD